MRSRYNEDWTPYDELRQRLIIDDPAPFREWLIEEGKVSPDEMVDEEGDGISLDDYIDSLDRSTVEAWEDEYISEHRDDCPYCNNYCARCA
jgi:hypothetical protein